MSTLIVTILSFVGFIVAYHTYVHCITAIDAVAPADLSIRTPPRDVPCGTVPPNFGPVSVLCKGTNYEY